MIVLELNVYFKKLFLRISANIIYPRSYEPFFPLHSVYCGEKSDNKSYRSYISRRACLIKIICISYGRKKKTLESARKPVEIH